VFGLAAPFEIVRRRTEDPAALHDSMCDQIRLVDLADADVDVEPFADQIHRPIHELEPHFQSRIPFREFRDGRRNVIASESETCADPKFAARICPDIGDCLLHRLDVLEDLPCPLVDRLAVFGDRHASSRPMEKLYPQQFFENRDPLADVGGGRARFDRGRGETGAASCDAEEPQVIDERLIIHGACSMTPR